MFLFEFGDLNWVPRWYHFYLRETLEFQYKFYKHDLLWLKGLSKFLKESPSDKVLECCSGSGKCLPRLIEHLPKEFVKNKTFILSDYRPLKQYSDLDRGAAFSYISKSLNATCANESYPLPKVFINSFHHFNDEMAKKILSDSLKNNNSILILEYTKKSLGVFISVILGSLSTFLLLPFYLKKNSYPFSILFFTYIIPLFPFVLLWDGIISNLRSRNLVNVERLCKDIDISSSTHIEFIRSRKPLLFLDTSAYIFTPHSIQK
jgi:hypothetical protein